MFAVVSYTDVNLVAFDEVVAGWDVYVVVVAKVIWLSAWDFNYYICLTCL